MAREDEAAEGNGAWLALGASCLLGTKSVGFSVAGGAGGEKYTAASLSRLPPPPVVEVERALVGGRPMPWETAVGAAHHPPGTRVQLAAAGAPPRSVATGKNADSKNAASKGVQWGSEEQGLPREGRAETAGGGARQASAAGRDGGVRQLFTSPQKGVTSPQKGVTSPAKGDASPKSHGRGDGMLGREEGGGSLQSVAVVGGSEREADLTEQVFTYDIKGKLTFQN